MKIIVYTILKNEIDNIEAWLANTSKADAVFLLDTGSTDGSWEKLQELKQKSYYPNLYIDQKIYEHFRFDEARNDNLAMVRKWAELNEIAEDVICWSIDLDERFSDEFWYEKTRDTARLHPNFTQLMYQYANRNNNHEIINQRFCVKCHHLDGGAHWVSPVHEYQEYFIKDMYTDGQITIHPTDILVSHYQNLKSDRTQYKDLAWKRIQTNKFDMIGWKHYLDACIDNGEDFDMVLSIELQMYGKALQCDCDWIDCICGNIATLLAGRSFDDTVMWYQRAIAANKTLRSYYLRLANYYLYNNFQEANADKALELLETMEREANVIHDYYKEIDGAHSWYADEVFGLALCWAGRYEEALDRFVKALKELDELNQNEEQYANRKMAYNRNLIFKEFAEKKLKEKDN